MDDCTQERLSLLKLTVSFLISKALNLNLVGPNIEQRHRLWNVIVLDVDGSMSLSNLFRREAASQLNKFDGFG